MNIHSAHFLPGTNKKLGNLYLLLECLGDGTHGWVWRAERLQDNKIVAVKIPKQLSKDDRVLSEGKELINAEKHPNVIDIYDMGRVPPEKEWFAIEMEYFPSESLAQKLENRSHNFGNTYKRLFNIYEQVLAAVEHLGALEVPVSHGDIKPHNILVGQDDLVKLTDFGSSALPEEIYVRTRENGGTVLYSAPEFSDCVSRKGSFSELILGDIYSLGVLLYQLMTGSLPHDTQSQVRKHAPFPKPTEINSGICDEMEQFILQCLEKLPCNRIQTIHQLKERFQYASICQLKAQVSQPSAMIRPSAGDWSTDVMEKLEKGYYRAAAQLAEKAFQETGDDAALLHQLNALYRDNRLKAFQEVFDANASRRETNSIDWTSIRLLAIKVCMTQSNLEMAKEILELALSIDGSCFELRFLDASISGLMTEFEEARKKLEILNQEQPGQVRTLRRLLMVCEQMRDYQAAAGYLRVLIRSNRSDQQLIAKRELYMGLGVW